MIINKVYNKSSENMSEVDDNSISLIITSPPYFNIKDYSKDGKQINEHSDRDKLDIGYCSSYDEYILDMLKIWKECERVLQPNGKLVINTPLLPMKRTKDNKDNNRTIYDIDSDIHNSIIKNTSMKLMDLYIWFKTNSSKKLMFGSYPYPTNFYNNNTSEFMRVFVKPGKSRKIEKSIKEKSKITQEEWVEYTKQIWNIPIPNKSDLAYGIHPAIMPEEIVRRFVLLFSFVDDIVLDPFAGSGTTLKVSKKLDRNYIGYELYENYNEVIEKKIKL